MRFDLPHKTVVSIVVAGLVHTLRIAVTVVNEPLGAPRSTGTAEAAGLWTYMLDL